MATILPVSSATCSSESAYEKRNHRFCHVKSSATHLSATQKAECLQKSSSEIKYSVQTFAQLNVKERIRFLNIYPSGRVEAITESGQSVLVENKLDHWEVGHARLDQCSYTLTQQNDGSYVIRSSVKGFGGGNNPPKGARPSKSGEKEKPRGNNKNEPSEQKKKNNVLLNTFNKYSAFPILAEKEMAKLIKGGADINAKDVGGETLLSAVIQAANTNSAEWIKVLLGLGADPNIVVKAHGPALYHAIKVAKLEYFPLLLAKADPTAAVKYAESKGEDCLWLACNATADYNKESIEGFFQFLEHLDHPIEQRFLDLATRDGKKRRFMQALIDKGCTVQPEHFKYCNSSTFETLINNYRGPIEPAIVNILGRVHVCKEAEAYLKKIESMKGEGILEAALCNQKLLSKYPTFYAELLQKGATLSDSTALIQFLKNTEPQRREAAEKVALAILDGALADTLPKELLEQLLMVAAENNYRLIAEKLLLEGVDSNFVPREWIHQYITNELVIIWERNESYMDFVYKLAEEILGRSAPREHYRAVMQVLFSFPYVSLFYVDNSEALLARDQFVTFIKDKMKFSDFEQIQTDLQKYMRLWLAQQGASYRAHQAQQKEEEKRDRIISEFREREEAILESLRVYEARYKEIEAQEKELKKRNTHQ